MNTIPSTFNSNLPSYTAVGGAVKDENVRQTGLSVILLNREGRYPRKQLFADLEKTGFDAVISVENRESRYDVEELSLLFPRLRFLLLQAPLTPGEQINLAVSECTTPLFFVLWNDLQLLHSGGALRMVERLRAGRQAQDGADTAGSTGFKTGFKRLCTVPLIQSSRFENLPTLVVPVREKGHIKTLLLPSGKEEQASLYPFDGVGIYDRERFIALGGFDSSLQNSHWQLADFGFRARLWGEEIAATVNVRLSYSGEAPVEDATVDAAYRRFYLKNLAPVFRGDSAALPWRRFPSYLFHSGSDLFEALADFKAAREWVHINRYRFRSDARAVLELWERPA